MKSMKWVLLVALAALLFSTSHSMALQHGGGSGGTGTGIKPGH